MRRFSQRSSKPSGQALTELALVLPVLLLLLLGAIDLGRVFYSQITVENAAKEGALVASQGGSPAAVRAAAVTEARGGFIEVLEDAVVPGASCDGAAYGATTSVSVSAPFQIITPLISEIVGGQDLTLSATAHADCLIAPELGAPPPLPCPSVSFTATHRNQHRMDLEGSISPLTTGWTWTWTLPGGSTRQGQTVDNYNFGDSGNFEVTLTVSKDACTESKTQTVQVP